ncbi:MAG: HD domain-containing protein [Sporomusaceae bacterium]|nr:HD domain-containing protein [Sporomusaceae bacterium]
MDNDSKKQIVGYVTHKVVDKHGRLLLAEGSALTPEMVGKLKERGLDFRISPEAFTGSSSRRPLVIKKRSPKIFKLPKRLDEKFEKLDRESIDHAAQYMNKILDQVRENTFLNDSLKILGQGHRATYSHSINVSLIAVALARKLELDTPALQELAIGALYHDVGKILLPKTVLNDITGVCDGQTLIYQQHTVLGSDLLATDTLAPSISLVALQHHEKYAGQGYPSGLKDNAIHPHAAIVCVANAFDRMTTAIYQKNVLTPEAAIGQIIAGAGVDYHPRVVDKFAELFVLRPTAG